MDLTTRRRLLTQSCEELGREIFPDALRAFTPASLATALCGGIVGKVLYRGHGCVMVSYPARNFHGSNLLCITYVHGLPIKLNGFPTVKCLGYLGFLKLTHYLHTSL